NSGRRSCGSILPQCIAIGPMNFIALEVLKLVTLLQEVMANVYEYGCMAPTDFIRETRSAIPHSQTSSSSIALHSPRRTGYERQDNYIFLSRRHDASRIRSGNRRHRRSEQANFQNTKERTGA